jgi:hypothetical protein
LIVVAAVDHGFADGPQPRVRIRDPLEGLPVDGSGRGRRGLERAGPKALGFAGSRCPRDQQRLDEQREPFVRLAKHHRRRSPAENRVAQALAFHGFAIHLHHRERAGIEIARHVQLRHRAVPLPHHRQELEQEDSQFR